jgi:hypothetical protein
MGQDLRAATVRDREAQITLHYNGDPMLRPGEAREVEVTCKLRGQAVAGAEPEVSVPRGWQVRGIGETGATFEVVADDFSGSEKLSVSVGIGGATYQASFTMLSPDAVSGFASAANVEYCPVCHGRAGACICG